MRRFYTLAVMICAGFLWACQNQTDATKTQSSHNHSAASTATNAARYTCPMHPHYISTDPDGQCPICGMDLVPAAGDAAADNTVSVSPDMIQTMGIRTVTVEPFTFTTAFRAFGTVEANERLASTVSARIDGWVNALSIRAEGDVVRRGQWLYSLYAPDMIAAQKDYLASLQIGNARRIEAVKQRLISKGFTPGLITQLTNSGTAIERIPVYANDAGVVTRLSVRDGDYVAAGAPIMALQRYDSVWIMADVQESTLPQIMLGTTARLRFDSAPRLRLTGVVDYIYPALNVATRTAKIRISVDNPDGVLRAGAYADIVFDTPKSTPDTPALSVPQGAVLRSSDGARVITALGGGRFEPRAVTTGQTAAGRTEILSGLREGDRVVASGQFMLDSEANLRGGLSKLSAPRLDYDAQTPLADLPMSSDSLLDIDHIIDMTLYFHEALIDGYRIDPTFLDPALQRIAALERRYAGSMLSPILSQSKTAITGAKTAQTPAALRDALSGLMQGLDPWLSIGAPTHYKDKGLIRYRDSDTQQMWLQEGNLPANPYSSARADEIAWPMTRRESTAP